ncbi:MAG TPA: ABC transporter ATP-binding protein [Anaerolineaceae bacterium]|nr:ABC transporter ATP-binding protein [Anaerolineaceae bacterium]
MIRAVGLTFRYSKHPPIFQDFDWQVEQGQTWAIIGASGCGKSTLLYLLAGLRRPDGGQLLINNQPLTGPRPQTGLILQDYGLLPWATLRQNVTLGLDLRRFYGPDGRHAPAEALPEDLSARVTHWLERLGIAGVAAQYPGQVSGGQRQRAAIARTLVLEPDLLLMDEPFASLDAPTREDLQSLVLQLHQERPLTTVLVTHTIEEAMTIGEKILVLVNRTNTTPLILDNPYAGQIPPPQDAGYARLTARMRDALRQT